MEHLQQSLRACKIQATVFNSIHRLEMTVPRYDLENSPNTVVLVIQEDLYKEAKLRKSENRPFTNKEITFLLYDVIN